jgi:glycosyltransferase involved in cell wall biosynthesis
MYKVCFDDIIFELQKAGGISKYWGKLIQNTYKNKDIKNVNIQGKNAKHNVFFSEKYSQKVTSYIFFPLSVRRYLPIFRTYDCDIVHSSYYRVPLFKRKNIKQVVTVHDFMYEFFDTGFKRKIHIWQKKKSMLNADAIICVSKHTKKDLVELYPDINSDILYIVPNGVDEEFKPLDQKKINSNLLLYVGNRSGCKNFEFILRLMSQSKYIQQRKFNLMCVGGGKFSKIELDLFKEYELSEVITQVLSVSNEKLNQFYNEAYALLFPSKYEGFGIPALEAQMAGCPVVYANTSSLPEVMGYTELGYTLDDLDGAVNALQLLENKDFKRLMIGKGILHASSLTWENSVNLTHEVYKKVIAHD